MPPLTHASATAPIASASSSLHQLEMAAAPPPNQPPSKKRKKNEYYSDAEEERLLELGSNNIDSKGWNKIAGILSTEFGNHRVGKEVKAKWQCLKVKQLQAGKAPAAS